MTTKRFLTASDINDSLIGLRVKYSTPKNYYFGKITAINGFVLEITGDDGMIVNKHFNSVSLA